MKRISEMFRHIFPSLLHRMSVMWKKGKNRKFTAVYQNAGSKKSSAEMPETENTAEKVRNFGSDAESRKENVRQMNGYHRINNPDDDLSAAIDAEIKGLEQY